MKRSFREADFDRLTALWNKCAPEKYHIDAAMLRLKTVECPVFDWGASVIEEADGDILGFVSVKKSAAEIYKGPDQDVYNLSLIAYCDPQFGVDLLSDVKRTLRNRGVARLTFGTDSGHFFPGCPDDFRSLADFLMIEGFVKSGEAVDLERDLEGYANPYAIPEDAEYRLLREDEQDKLDAFLEREFPGRWHYDVLDKISADGVESCFALFRDGQIDGFAMIQDWTHTKPTGGAVWRVALGDKWGSLGPIGVSADLRGKVYGHALLGQALSELRDRKVRQCIIDWTGLVDFYGKHGFVPTRKYHYMSLALGD